MSQVISFEGYQPSARYDSLPWTEVHIAEGTASDGTFVDFSTQALLPLDADPANPAFRDFTATTESDEADLWYQLTFYDAAGAFAQPTFPVQNTSDDDRPIYASVSELAQILRVSASSRHAALTRVLRSAAEEIDSEIGTADIDGTELPYSNPPSLVREVSLERAVEHWQQMQSPFGIIGVGDTGATYTARDSWQRHAHKLAPLVGSYGLA
jgi:hypothetical protein